MSTASAHRPDTVRDDLLREVARTTYCLLSPMEQSVLVAAARGAEDKQIAASLECSISTVRTLWQRIYHKTGLTSRRKLIAKIWSEALRSVGGVVV
ncbi:response regulator transcription factor [Lysobacter gummosus]|uniref:response regulator transcription factor n=1 Tax=Lysobacter gummosus TaxID=262324 RepID=UPI002E2F607D|nr:helix-turn-helix transcriptional regulator [Lysobacter gummosus]